MITTNVSPEVTRFAELLEPVVVVPEQQNVWQHHTRPGFVAVNAGWQFVAYVQQNCVDPISEVPSASDRSSSERRRTRQARRFSHRVTVRCQTNQAYDLGL